MWRWVRGLSPWASGWVGRGRVMVVGRWVGGVCDGVGHGGGGGDAEGGGGGVIRMGGLVVCACVCVCVCVRFNVVALHVLFVRCCWFKLFLFVFQYCSLLLDVFFVLCFDPVL